MNRGNTSRRWLIAWAIFLSFMCLAAFSVRDARFKSLARSITRDLTPFAEQGIKITRTSSSGHTWTYNNYLSDHQGPMVWLIEHGYRDPALLRVMLLCEARRSEDHVYLYTGCFNWDLRQHLIAECRSEFPEDPQVAWATGRCYLAAGEYEQAAVELMAAQRLRFDPDKAGVSTEHFIQRIITAQLMNGMPEGAVEFAALQVQGNETAVQDYRIHADLLCKLERYDETIAAANNGLQQFPDDSSLSDVKFRALWWTGNFNAATALYCSNHPSHILRTSTDPNGWRSFLKSVKSGDAPFIDLDGVIPLYGAIAEWCAITGDHSRLAIIEDHIASRHAELESSGNSRSRYDPDWVVYAELELARAYVLTRQWDRLHDLLPTIKNPPWGVPRSTYDTAILLSSIAQTCAPMETANSYWGYRSLVESGTLPYLLYSSHFAAAAEHSGRDVDIVRAEVIVALAPERGMYRDHTNGELDWCE